MECFRQIFRCVRAPFKRERGRVIEIGPPTNFRKEELPACFSDAESVLSPSQNATERPNLTTETQDLDVAGQSYNDRGERRDNDRDDAVTIVNEEQAPRPRAQTERETITNRIRKRLNALHWWKSRSTAPHEQSADNIAVEEMRPRVN
ncbi:hypothetical protein MYU51_017659 [Penicillium brevicompactum]|uniref:uncharacterized protein n=1 Tax=Penicillium brevicompactum TaxID=5074 RepID=UPI002540FF93|nr:uncharacterized protein N7506_010312 [Penicillium brevicompactum]KAJ5327210.1 hypothetical protein N7506_010312 [Penicillium brevicompactum]